MLFIQTGSSSLGSQAVDFHITYLLPDSFNKRCWGMNLGPSMCQADVLPLRHSPSQQTSSHADLTGSKMGWSGTDPEGNVHILPPVSLVPWIAAWVSWMLNLLVIVILDPCKLTFCTVNVLQPYCSIKGRTDWSSQDHLYNWWKRRKPGCLFKWGSGSANLHLVSRTTQITKGICLRMNYSAGLNSGSARITLQANIITYRQTVLYTQTKIRMVLGKILCF